MESLNVYSNIVPSDISSICLVVEGVLNSLRRICGQLSDATVFDLKVVLNELLVNAIVHGNRENKKKTVRISAEIADKNKLSIIIEDEGCGYDHSKLCSEQTLKPCDTTPDNVCECGRGLRIVKSLCNDVKVNPKGNKIIVMKYLE